MNAIVQRRYGPPEVLVSAVLPDPVVGPTDLLVEVRAAAVTQGDRRLRSGDFPGFTWLPGRLAVGLTGPRAQVPGSMFAGRVVAVGPKVTRFAPGDDVFGACMAGAYAERLVIREDAAVARLPAGFSHAEAAALSYGAGTAVTFVERSGLRAGERLLVIGAAGGVGRYVVQLGRSRGAHVTAVARPEHHGWLRELGADEVLAPDAVSGTWDVVFDTPDALTLRSAWPLLAPGGRFVSIGVSLVNLAAMVFGRVFGGRRVITGASFDDAASCEALRMACEQGVLRPRVGRRFPLAEAAAAHAHLERDRPAAEVVVEPVRAA